MRPASARMKPVMTLNSVVLPAPFGPINAVIEARRTSSVAPSIAWMPPKALETRSTSRIRPSSVTEHHLPALAEHSLWPERHEEDEQEADEHEAQGGDLLGGKRQLEEARGLQQRPQHERAQRDAGVARQAAEYQNRVA